MKYISEQPSTFPGVPARRSISESAAWENQVGPELAEAYRVAVSTIKPRSEMQATTYNPISWPFYTWRSEALRGVINGEEPRALLETAQQKAEDYLSCMAVVDLSEMTEEQQQQEVIACAKQADPEGQW
jgi:hypothetical protein